MAIQIERNFEVFRRLIMCNHNIYSWTYTAQMELIYNNCPAGNEWDKLLQMDIEFRKLSEYAARYHAPLFITNQLGVTWVAEGEDGTDGKLQRIHVIGPVFTDEVTLKDISAHLDEHQISVAVKIKFLQILESVPTVALSHIMEYGLMQHYCIYEEYITMDSYVYPGERHSLTVGENDETDHRRTWISEQKHLKYIEDGNLNYKSEKDPLIRNTVIGKMNQGEPDRQYKNMVIIHIALCTRAAIKGGLSPHMAYTLSDRYIQKTEASRSMAELADINSQMQEEFVMRVHRCKTESDVSTQIKECCDYISLHAEKKITISELADRYGYSVYYLSKKFKKEMGMDIHAYINKMKIDQAKNLLTSGSESIQEISSILGFSSHSYFSNLFKKETGMTPRQYREHKDSVQYPEI